MSQMSCFGDQGKFYSPTKAPDIYQESEAWPWNFLPTAETICLLSTFFFLEPKRNVTMVTEKVFRISAEMLKYVCTFMNI